VARQQAATLAQSGVSTVEETRSPRKRGAADQSIGTRKAAKTMQGSAFEHVERKAKKSNILWADPVSVEFVTCPTRGVFKGIDGVESILRNKYLRVDPLAQHDIRSDNITCPLAQSGAPVVARQQAATLAQSGVSTVEETRSPRKRGAADQSIGTRKAAKTTQGSAFEHVERKPKKSNILWADPVSVEFVTCPTRGVFKGINGVESILRNKYLRVDPLAQHDIRSDNITCPPAQSGAHVVAWQQAATLAQSGVSTVEETRSPRKRGAADQSIGTRKAAKTMQGFAFEHVGRKPKKSRILWADPVSVEFVTCPTRGVFKGINGVESILRNKYLRVDPLAQHDIRSDNKDPSNESNHQAEHGTNSSQ
jgi:hypothetical protein